MTSIVGLNYYILLLNDYSSVSLVYLLKIIPTFCLVFVGFVKKSPLNILLVHKNYSLIKPLIIFRSINNNFLYTLTFSIKLPLLIFNCKIVDNMLIIHDDT